MKLTIDSQLKTICSEIQKQNWTINQWSDHESCDWFQTPNYCGGFDATEEEFCFSFYDKNQKEYWFQFALESVEQIIDGQVNELEMEPKT